MSGLSLSLTRVPGGLPPVVTLGRREAQRTVRIGTCAVVVSRSPDSRQLYLREDRRGLLLVEGTPDRLPRDDERASDYFAGRRGSFRGLEVERASGDVLAFTDPMGSRPLYLARTPTGVFLSDKAATVVTACGQGEPAWGPLLEQLLVGSVLGGDCTVEGVTELSPGALVRVTLTGETVVAASSFVVEDPEARRRPVRALVRALSLAVDAADDDAELLLSGGLDSRLALAAAAPGRRALHVTTTSDARAEAVASEVARRCGTHLRVVRREPHDYVDVAAVSDLLTGGVGFPLHAHHLGLSASSERAFGGSGLTHAYLFDTLLKGLYLLRPKAAAREVRLRSVDGRSLRLRALLLRHKRDNRSPGRIVATLSDDGAALLDERLRALDERLAPLVVDGFDHALERAIRAHVARHSSYGNLLGWLEEHDVWSPALHPALWSWASGCPARFRHRGRALNAALLVVAPRLALVRDGDTGIPLGLGSGVARRVLSRLRAEMTSPRVPPALASRLPKKGWPIDVFRAAQGRALLEDGISALASTPFFREEALQQLLRGFLAGDDRHGHTVVALASTGVWLRRISQLRDGAAAPWRVQAIEPTTAPL